MVRCARRSGPASLVVLAALCPEAVAGDLMPFRRVLRNPYEAVRMIPDDSLTRWFAAGKPRRTRFSAPSYGLTPTASPKARAAIAPGSSLIPSTMARHWSKSSSVAKPKAVAAPTILGEKNHSSMTRW